MPLARIHTFRDLLAHLDWARDRLLAAAQPLTRDELDRVVPLVGRSLRAVLVDLFAEERLWLTRLIPDELPDVATGNAPDAVRELAVVWPRIAAVRAEFVDRIEPEQWGEPVASSAGASSHALPVRDVMLHVINHGAHERAAALNCLRHLGKRVAAPGLDYLFYRVEHPTVLCDPDTRERLATAGLKPTRELSPPTRFSVPVLRRYFAYSDWAMHRILQVVMLLSEADIDQRFEIGLGSIRATILHICDAEKWWQSAWEGEPAPRFEALPKITPLPVAAEMLVNVEQQRDMWLKHTEATRLETPIEVIANPDLPLRFRVGESLLQLCGHATHHRAQLAAMIRAVGAEPPVLSYITWREAVASGAFQSEHQ